MIDKLKKAIAKRLKENFPDFKVYIANPAQNMQEPCFIVEVRDVDSRDLAYIPGVVREITEVFYSFTVTFLVPRNNHLLNEVMTRALLCLKWLSLEDEKLVLTTERHANLIDDSSGVITFKVFREVHVIGERPELMDEMIEHVGLKE